MKSYSSKIGIGAAPSKKTLGRMVIFLGSDLPFLQDGRKGKKNEISKFLLEIKFECNGLQFKMYLYLYFGCRIILCVF